MRVGLSRAHFPVTTLGPGRRVGVWFQGCSLACRGCISQDTWAEASSLTDLDELLGVLERWLEDADGLTISGGEPMEQVEALVALLAWWRSRAATSVLVFTGRDFDDITVELAALEGLVDAIITGRFDITQPQTLALRGSDNQQLHILTPLGEQFRAFERPRGSQDRALDLAVLPNGEFWFAGIPDRGTLQQLRRDLAAAGHQARTSDLAPVRER